MVPCVTSAYRWLVGVRIAFSVPLVCVDARCTQAQIVLVAAADIRQWLSNGARTDCLHRVWNRSARSFL